MGRALCWIALALTLPALAAAAPATAPATLQVRWSRASMAVGEVASLEVVVRGATGTVGSPEFAVPDGLEVLSSGRTQGFAWVDGRSSSEVVFRYELGATAAGRFTVGPVRVVAGSQALASPPATLIVSAAAARIGGGEGGGAGPVALRVDVEPARPFVGQPVLMRIRLVLRAPLAEDPQYSAPATPGFWGEPPSPPESYYAAQGNARVQVTETRTRLYPLAPGVATIGVAEAVVALASSEGDDPRAWVGGRVPRREARARSAPVRVEVRPLPAGAPPGFDGAVGSFTPAWSADRARTARDVPVTVRLDVRGVGNLPLLHTPALAADDFEVFTSAVDDSLGALGMLDAGRRRFQWTVLPRHEGPLRIAPPPLVWFDPAGGVYRSAVLAALTVQVDPPLRDGPAPAAFPPVFTAHPVDPGARPAAPWGGVVAGLALGAALALWRAAGRPPADAGERARQREWLRAVGLARGPDFWRAADEAAGWLAARGDAVQELSRAIASARYGGAVPDEEAVRRRIVERLGHAMPPPSGPWGMRAVAVALAVGAVVMAVACAPKRGEEGAARRARAADQRAQSGDVAGAADEWRRLWSEGGHASGVAARLAWVAVRDGEVGPAAAWVLRGRRGEPRDGALAWVTERVREGGGLVGSAATRLPLRSLEWGLLALALGVAAGAVWPRRGAAAALALLAFVAAAVWPLEGERARRSHDAVVRTVAPLEGAAVSLDAGQVVHVVARDGGRVRVVAGRGLEGWMPAEALVQAEDGR